MQLTRFIRKQFLHRPAVGALPNHSKPGYICAVILITRILVANTYLKYTPSAVITYQGPNGSVWIISDISGKIVFICIYSELTTTGDTASKDDRSFLSLADSQVPITTSTLNSLMNTVLRKHGLQVIRARIKVRLHKLRTIIPPMHLHPPSINLNRPKHRRTRETTSEPHSHGWMILPPPKRGPSTWIIICILFCSCM